MITEWPQEAIVKIAFSKLTLTERHFHELIGAASTIFETGTQECDFKFSFKIKAHNRFWLVEQNV